MKNNNTLLRITFILGSIMLTSVIYFGIKTKPVKSCQSGEIISGGICVEKSITGGSTSTNSSGEIINENRGYGTYDLNLGGIYSENHDILKYKKIKINESIDGLRIFITIDFPPRFKEKYSSYTTSNGFKFALKYFLGEKGFDEEGGFYNVLRNSSCSNLINDPSKGLDGAIVGKDINGGHTWVLDLTKKAKIALEKEKCKPGLQYTYTDTLGFINRSIGKELYVGGYLSHVGEGANHGPIKGREVSLVKEIKIEYIGNDGAIEIVQ